MTKEMKAGIAAAVAEWARTRLESLDHIRETMLGTIQAERERIAKLEESAFDDYLDSLEYDQQLFEEAEVLVGGLLLVGLYSAVEHFAKQLLRHRYPAHQVKQLYRIENLKEALARDCSVNLASIRCFEQIDELRQKNNKVKHGEPIGESALAAYGRLKDAVVPYLEQLALAVIPD